MDPDMRTAMADANHEREHGRRPIGTPGSTMGERITDEDRTRGQGSIIQRRCCMPGWMPFMTGVPPPAPQAQTSSPPAICLRRLAAVGARWWARRQRGVAVAVCGRKRGGNLPACTRRTLSTPQYSSCAIFSADFVGAIVAAGGGGKRAAPRPPPGKPPLSLAESVPMGATGRKGSGDSSTGSNGSLGRTVPATEGAGAAGMEQRPGSDGSSSAGRGVGGGGNDARPVSRSSLRSGGGSAVDLDGRPKSGGSVVFSGAVVFSDNPNTAPPPAAVPAAEQPSEPPRASPAKSEQRSSPYEAAPYRVGE